MSPSKRFQWPFIPTSGALSRRSARKGHWRVAHIVGIQAFSRNRASLYISQFQVIFNHWLLLCPIRSGQGISSGEVRISTSSLCLRLLNIIFHFETTSSPSNLPVRILDLTLRSENFLRQYCAQHRPLSTRLVLPGSTWPLFVAEKALGAAYWRSDQAKSRTLSIIQLHHDEDPVSFDLETTLESLSSAINLGTKRTFLRSHTSSWERSLTSDNLVELQGLRDTVSDLEASYKNLQSDSLLLELSTARLTLEHRITVFQKKSLEIMIEGQRKTAKDHSLAWKVFSSMDDNPSSIPIPPPRS